MGEQILNNEMNEALSAKDKRALLNDKEFQDEVVKIAGNVLTQLYKALWTKRSFWKTTLKNKSS